MVPYDSFLVLVPLLDGNEMDQPNLRWRDLGSHRGCSEETCTRVENTLVLGFQSQLRSPLWKQQTPGAEPKLVWFDCSSELSRKLILA
jgi:hypothetical protein